MKKRSATLLFGLAYLSFISLGLPDGVFGVAWPSIRAHFKLPFDALGPLLVMLTLGYLLASFGSGRILARMNVGALLAWSCLATSLSLFGYAMTQWWWLMVGLGALAGLGAGAIDAGLNTYAATHFSAASVNWLHAFYGVGATLGPMIMTSVLNAPLPWQWGYVIVGAAQLLLAACFGLTHKRWSNGRHDEVASNDLVAASRSVPVTSASHSATLRRPVAWLGIGVFFVYTGIEAAAGAWSYSLFTESRGVAMITAGTWVSVYWGALTAGRLLSGLVVNYMPVHVLLRFCMLGLALGATMMWLNLTHWFSFLGFAMIGLCCAPIFPSMIATTPERLGAAHTANAVGFQLAAAVLGAALLPSLVGVLARYFTLEILSPFVLSAALLLWILSEAMPATDAKQAKPVQAAA
ncbi:MFS transporter [candidate division KSB1 bacterium]|nr:MFS transporter [candidate division KSB1 bacterium]